MFFVESPHFLKSHEFSEIGEVIQISFSAYRRTRVFEVLIHLSHCLNASEQGGNGENGEFEVQRLELGLAKYWRAALLDHIGEQGLMKSASNCPHFFF